MKTKLVLLVVLLICICFTVGGCFYLRLQQVKLQLAKFDDYYEINEGQRFAIIAKEPILFSADVVRIMETSPSNTTAEGWNQLFDYTLEKQYQTGQNEPNNYDITISFQFNEEDKLSEVFIDRKFFATMPKWMFIASIKALGNSNVDTHHRKISGNYNDPLGAENLHIADANEVLLLLGIPYTQDSNSLTYKYELHHRLLKMEKPNYCP